MNILGIGIVFCGGRGIKNFENALRHGWKKPESGRAAYLVDSDTLKDRSLFKNIRRSDKFSRMAVMAASDALSDSDIDKKKLGVIVSTAFGPHVTTFNFLDGLIDYGDAGVSPLQFSNSVHNAAASYITGVLGINGPCLTVTQFYFPFQYALMSAKIWLEENRCDYCLVGAVEQYGDVLDYIQNKKLNPAPDCKIKPFNFKPTYQVPGEGAVFFLVGKENRNVFCQIKLNEPNIRPDLNIIDTDGMLDDESLYLSHISSDVPTAAYSPLFGSMMTGSAFNCAAGALMLKNKTCYPNPVEDNPENINLLSKQPHKVDSISCIRFNCDGKKKLVCLTVS